MRVMPIRYTTDVPAAVRFYEALGLRESAASRPGTWTELSAAAGVLAIHAAGQADAGACELAFATDEPLEDVAARLAAAGFAAEPIVDENFGRSTRVRDADGVWVQINEYDRELYT